MPVDKSALDRPRGKIIMGSGSTSISTFAANFIAPYFNSNVSTTESQRVITLPFDAYLVRTIVSLTANTLNGNLVFGFRDDGVTIGSQTLTGTGQKDSGAIRTFIAAGSLVCFSLDSTAANSGAYTPLPMIAVLEPIT